MKNRAALWLLLAGAGLGIASAQAAPGPGETNSAILTQGQSLEEKDACTKNLRTIYTAITAYQADHKDLPNWLSDLVPQYLSDANALICPVCRRTGRAESPPLADPRLPSSYLFEFCPVPMGGGATNAPTRTRREWKRRQMGLVGSVVPLVRCRHHEVVLNLAFDGNIYESPPMWEWTVTNRVTLAELSANRLFASDSLPNGKSSPKPAGPRFPARDPKARKQLLDLTSFYNAKLTASWHGNAGNDLAALPQGVQTLAGIEFDVRGIVQLGSKSDSASKYPAQVQGIKVRQQCQRLHFLHAAGFGNPVDNGKQIGAYVVHYATNSMRLEIPIIYGQDVRNWHSRGGEKAAAGLPKVAWTGQNNVSKQAGGSIRLFLTTWTNFLPGVQIQSIDYISSMATPAPFLIAITADNNNSQ